MVVKNVNDVAKILDKTRDDFGASKNRLAKESGMSRPTLLNIIHTGKKRNGYDMANFFKIANTLGLKVTIE